MPPNNRNAQTSRTKLQARSTYNNDNRKLLSICKQQYSKTRITSLHNCCLQKLLSLKDIYEYSTFGNMYLTNGADMRVFFKYVKTTVLTLLSVSVVCTRIGNSKAGLFFNQYVKLFSVTNVRQRSSNLNT